MRCMAAACLLTLCACGAKTGLDVPRATDEPMDASTRADADAGDASGADVECVDVRLSFMVTPTVVLVVDQSGSMGFDLPSGRTRWDVLRDSLVGPRGLVTELESRVRFGLALYSARSELGSDGGPPIGPCPLITDVRPTLRNRDAIASVYDASEPIEDTPTADAIDAVRASLVGAVDPRTSPTLFILATDGEPDTCAQLDPQEGQEEAVAAASAAFDAGIRTFVIGVGEDTVSRAHLQDMANAGVGASPGVRADFWQADDDAGLRRALRQIVREEASCEIVLDRRVDPALACRGAVALNGRTLPCDDADGWRLLDSRRVQILGAACDEIAELPGSTIDAVFPCEALLE